MSISVPIFTPAGNIRGTLAVVTGRGESALVYERFGKRLSGDGYLVGVFEGDAEAATAWLGEQDVAPRILVGSDSGAGAALSRAVFTDGVVVAGVLTETDANEAAPAERTACPLHLGVLGRPEAQTTNTAAIAAPAASELAEITVPVLAFHGGADAITAFEVAEQTLSPIANLQLVENVDGLHDALNDAQHRSVAATLVLWLEQLRAGGTVVRTASERVVA